MTFSKNPKNAKPAATKPLAKGSGSVKRRVKRPTLYSSKSKLDRSAGAVKKAGTTGFLKKTKKTDTKAVVAGNAETVARSEKKSKKRSSKEINITWLKSSKKVKLKESTANQNPADSNESTWREVIGREVKLSENERKKLVAKTVEERNSNVGNSISHAQKRPFQGAQPTNRQTTKKTNHRGRPITILTPATKKLNKKQKNKAVGNSRNPGKPSTTTNEKQSKNDSMEWKASTDGVGTGKKVDAKKSGKRSIPNQFEECSPPVRVVSMEQSCNQNASSTTCQKSNPLISNIDIKCHPNTKTNPIIHKTKKRKVSIISSNNKETSFGIATSTSVSRKRFPNKKVRTVAPASIKSKDPSTSSGGLPISDETLTARYQEQTTLISMLKKTIAEKDQQLKTLEEQRTVDKTAPGHNTKLSNLEERWISLQSQFEKQIDDFNKYETEMKKRDNDLNLMRTEHKQQDDLIRTWKLVNENDPKSKMLGKHLHSLVQRVALGLAELRNIASEICEKDKSKISTEQNPLVLRTKQQQEQQKKETQGNILTELKRKEGLKKQSLEKYQKQREEKKTQLLQINEKMESNKREVENLENLKGTEMKRDDSLRNRISKLRIRLQTSRSKVVKKGLERNLKDLERQQSACKKLIASLNAKLHSKSRELESQRLNSKAYREKVHALSRSIISDAREVEKLRASIAEELDSEDWDWLVSPRRVAKAKLETAADGLNPEEEPTLPQSSDIVLKEVGNFPSIVQLEKLIAIRGKDLKSLVIRCQLLLAQKQAAVNKGENQQKAKVESLEARIGALTKEKKVALVILERLRKEIKAKSAHVKEFQAGMDRNRANLHLLETEVKTKDAQIALLKKEEGEIKDQIPKLQKKTKAKNSELTKLREQQIASIASMQELQKSIKLKEKEIKELSAEKRTRKETHDSTLDRLNAELERKKKQMEELVKKQGLSKEVIDRMTKEAEEQDERIMDLSKKLRTNTSSSTYAAEEDSHRYNNTQEEVQHNTIPAVASSTQHSVVPITSFDSSAYEVELIDFTGLAKRSFLRIREQRKFIVQHEMRKAKLQEEHRSKDDEIEKLRAHNNDKNLEIIRLRTRQEDAGELSTILQTELGRIRQKIGCILQRSCEDKETSEISWSADHGRSEPPLSAKEVEQVSATKVPAHQPAAPKFSPPTRPPPNIAEDPKRGRASDNGKVEPAQQVRDPASSNATQKKLKARPGTRVEMTSGARKGTYGIVTRWSEKNQRYSVTLDDGLKIRCREGCFKVKKPRADRKSAKKREGFDPDEGLVKRLPFNYPKSAIEVSKNRENVSLKLMGKKSRDSAEIPFVVGKPATIIDVGNVARRMNKTGYLTFPSVDGLTREEIKFRAGEQAWDGWEPSLNMEAIVKHIWKKEGFALLSYTVSEEAQKYLVIEISGLGLGPVVKINPPKDDKPAGPEDLTKHGDASCFIMETLSNPWNIIMSGQSDDGSIAPHQGQALLNQFPKVVSYMRKELPYEQLHASTRVKVEVTLISIWLLQTRYIQREKEYSNLRFNGFAFLKSALKWPSNVINHFLVAMTYADHEA